MALIGWLDEAVALILILIFSIKIDVQLSGVMRMPWQRINNEQIAIVIWPHKTIRFACNS